MTERHAPNEEDQELVRDVTQLIEDLDHSPPDQMTPLFYRTGLRSSASQSATSSASSATSAPARTAPRLSTSDPDSGGLWARRVSSRGL